VCRPCAALPESAAPVLCSAEHRPFGFAESSILKVLGKRAAVVVPSPSGTWLETWPSPGSTKRSCIAGSAGFVTSSCACVHACMCVRARVCGTCHCSQMRLQADGWRDKERMLVLNFGACSFAPALSRTHMPK